MDRSLALLLPQVTNSRHILLLRLSFPDLERTVEVSFFKQMLMKVIIGASDDNFTVGMT